MKAGWQRKTLAAACQIKPPKAEARERFSGNALVSFVPMEDLGIDQKFMKPCQAKPLSDVAGSYTYFADGDVLLAKITPCFENGKLGIAADLTNGIGFGSSEYIVFRPDRTLNKEWLYYYLSRDDFRIEARAILSLYDRVKTQVVDLTHSQHSIRAVDFIFQSPIFPASLFTNHSEIPKPTANRILTLLRDEGILLSLQEGRGRRPGIYAFRELLNVAEGNEVF